MARRPLLSYFGSAPIDPARSALMSRVRGEGTAPELALRHELSVRGCRYRCHVKDLPGWPDISNKAARVAVFVDGCFWHGCPNHFRRPKTRTDFWVEKVRRNREKRKTVLKQYGQDWQVVQVYECAVRRNVGAVADRVASAIHRGHDRRSPSR